LNKKILLSGKLGKIRKETFVPIARQSRFEENSEKCFLIRYLVYVYVEEWWGSLRERDHWGDPDVDGRIILRWIFRKWEGVVGTGWRGLRIGTGGGHL
jgi:hypothetical protein